MRPSPIVAALSLACVLAGICADARSGEDKPAGSSGVEVVKNPDSIQLELAIIGLDEKKGLKEVKGLGDFEEKTISALEEGIKGFKKSEVALLVIRKMKSGASVMRSCVLKVNGAPQPDRRLTGLGKAVIANALVERRMSTGEVLDCIIQDDGPVLFIYPIPRETTDAVLEFTNQKPIALRFKLR